MALNASELVAARGMSNNIPIWECVKENLGPAPLRGRGLDMCGGEPSEGQSGPARSFVELLAAPATPGGCVVEMLRIETSATRDRPVALPAQLATSRPDRSASFL